MNQKSTTSAFILHLNQGRRHSWFLFTAILFAPLLLSFPTLHAQTLKYKVLLIGNSSYVNFPELKDAPIKDVDAMYQVLIGLGLREKDITVVKDLRYSEFLTTLIDFRAKLSADDAVLFYYSGHGFSMDGNDYLAPVDFAFGETKDITRRKSIGVAQVVTYLASTKSRVIVLDACRTDAPLLKGLVRTTPKASMDPLISSRSEGSLIAYSASSGKASDARSPSGLSFYTQYLVNSLAARPKDMYTALYNAKLATADASAGRQVPAVYDEMQGSFDFSKEATPGPEQVSLKPKEEADQIARLLQKTCSRSVLWQPVAFEVRGEVYKSVIGLQQDAEQLRGSLPAQSAAAKPLLGFEVASKRFVQIPNLFDAGPDTPSQPPNDRFRTALCSFRESVSAAKLTLEKHYKLSNQCPVVFACDVKEEGSRPSPARAKPTLHDTDESGIRYHVTWSVDANCTGWEKNVAADPKLANGHSCEFTHTQRKIGASNDPFDHWNIAVQAPGQVYDVDCQKNGWELFEDGTNGENNRHKGVAEGSWGRCTGYINGGDDPVTVTAYYRILR